MFCPRVRAARGSHYCSNYLWPTQLCIPCSGRVVVLACWGGGEVAGAAGAAGAAGIAGLLGLPGRDPPLLAI
jgi:hypothetical protein